MSRPSPSDVTRLLEAVGAGDRTAGDALLPAVYEQLRALAADHLRHERPGHTLQATALVHEAYVRLVGDRDVAWANRGHFYVAAAEAMRRVLIDHARRRGAVKRGGGWRRVDLDVAGLAADEDLGRILALDEVLLRLEGEDARAASVVRLRFYAGLSIEQAALVLDLSPRTIKREWTFARAWLGAELRRVEPGAETGDGEDR